MPDREKVIKGLEQFITDFKPFCGNKSDWQRVEEALTLLKAQEQVVMAGAELTDAELIEEIRKAPIVLKPAVDAVPIKPLSVWLAGYAVPPKYTVETNPVDSAKARAEGWEKHIRNLIECGLMEEE